MCTSREAMDGPAVLKLHTWRPFQFQFKLSDFNEAILSPTRKLLLLWSYHCEVFLVPLESDILMNGDNSEKFYSDRCHETASLTKFSQERTVLDCTDSLENVPYTIKHADMSSSASSTSDFYHVISGVKSYTWGHFRGAYSQIEDSGFRELLFVSGDNEIIIHAFHHIDKATSHIEPLIDKSVCGKWVEWGPNYHRHLQDHFREFGIVEGDIVCPNESSDKTKTCDSYNDDIPSHFNATRRKWFRTFFFELDQSFCGSRCFVRFPKNYLFPPCAEAVSFNIYDYTLKFLSFLSYNNYSDKKEKRDSKSVFELDDEMPISTKTKIAVPDERYSWRNGLARIPYKCSRVFSSTSYHYIGLVMTNSENVSRDVCDGLWKNASKVLVVIIILYQWGLEWLCSVDLQDLNSGQGLEPEWADFKFLDNFLVSLSTSGLICLWDAKHGKLVAHLNVHHTFGLNAQVHSELDLSISSGSNSEFRSRIFKEKIDHGSQILGDDAHVRDTQFRTFTKLMVASQSMLLACIDEHGVVYVVFPTDYILTDYHMQHSDIDIFSNYKIAGCEIGCQKSSGFSDVQGSRVEHWKLSHSKSTRSSPIRRIFLPVERYKKDDPICFSPFGITRIIRSCNSDKQTCSIIHFCLHMTSSVLDETDLFKSSPSSQKSVSHIESIGCLYNGYLYLVTEAGISVILPSVSISSNFHQVESLKYWQPSIFVEDKYYPNILLEFDETREPRCPWQTEVLSRALLFESPEEAERICLINGWGLKIARMCRLQLALHYMKYDEIKKSLELLSDIDMAEEAVLRLLFTSVYAVVSKVGSENAAALSSSCRLLFLGACFATKMVRRYGLDHKKDKLIHGVKKDMTICHFRQIVSSYDFNHFINTKRLTEMSHFLEVIRNIQIRLSSENRRVDRGMKIAEGGDATNMAAVIELNDDSSLPLETIDTLSSQRLDASELQELGGADSIKFEDNNGSWIMQVLPPMESSMYALKSRDMVARWGMENFDVKSVVKDALHSGRLPLAVLQLHIKRLHESNVVEESHDNFHEISGIGRAIAYDLFLKGNAVLAVEILRRLGEDIEVNLRQLLFGTVKRSFRAQISQEIQKYGYLSLHEWETLERLYIIEKLYPSKNFWCTFFGKQNKNLVAQRLEGQDKNSLKMVVNISNNLCIECGDVDGVVLGLWACMGDGSSSPFVTEDYVDSGYWACAATWSDAWDTRTMDRISLDQPFQADLVQWDSKFEYYMSHNELLEVCKLLDVIPSSLLPWMTLKINLNDSISPVTERSNVMKSPNQSLYICGVEEVDPVCLDVPSIKILRFPASFMCSTWVKMTLEKELAKKKIFLEENWESAAEIMMLLSRAGLIVSLSEFIHKDTPSHIPLELNTPSAIKDQSEDTVQALHQLVLHYCMEHDLPFFLDLYLDHHNLGLSESSLSSLLEAAGDCHWVRWLLLSRIKGHEYEASFSNACYNLSPQMKIDCNISFLDIGDVVQTVDDIAERAGEMAALATLMYAAVPIQNCLSHGSVNRNRSSFQCTLENLRSGLQHFPTLWRILASSCSGQDLGICLVIPNAMKSHGKSPFLEYLSWRDSLFFSTGGDTSLLQMLPCWFSKHIRRLIRLFVQGPHVWQTMTRSLGEESLFQTDCSFFNISHFPGSNSVSWEASIQKNIEEELYFSLEKENGDGLEHYLHRGRTLAGFSHLLGLRAQKLKTLQATQVLRGQSNLQSDVQTLLAPLTHAEGSLISSVVSVAITHFEDYTLIGSCALLLELCGLSANNLRVDIAVLQRISSYYNSIGNSSVNAPVYSKSVIHEASYGVDFISSLSHALADASIYHDNFKVLQQGFTSKVGAGRQLLHSLIMILQHLEKATLPVMGDGNTCGSWLLNGIGDGSDFRSLQKDASRHWKLVMAFCQMHNLPLSTKYLALLAKDNDWVGFLTEAQIGGFPVEGIIQVADREFTDSRLKTHILSVLRNMQSHKNKAACSVNSSTLGSNNDAYVSGECDTAVPVELFSLLAECEKQKNPGESLLSKARNLHWPLLAVIASCFPDVSPLSCLTVWLEITASRETSIIKINDLYTKIARSVKAAVEATNKVPSESRIVTHRFNRKNPKRRRVVDHPAIDSTDLVNMESDSWVSSSQVCIIEDDERGPAAEEIKISADSEERLASLSNMVAVLCEKHLFLPLLRAFEMFLPACSLLSFIRALQAFSQMRLSEASALLASFSARIKEESFHLQTSAVRDGRVRTTWISSTAVRAAEAILLNCSSAYEKRCLLQLLSVTDFGDGGPASVHFRQLYWKINLAEPTLRREDDLYLGNGTFDDLSLLTALQKHGHWEQARNWAIQLESSGSSWKSVVHHVTEKQAEAMVTEWKEFLWDIPEERATLWSHCQKLFVRYSFPELQAGLFFLKHAEEIEKEISAKELHEMLLMSLQWLSGVTSQSNPVYPLHLLREIETRVWLLAVESEVQSKSEGDMTLTSSIQNQAVGNTASFIEETATIIAKMDNHINVVVASATERNDTTDNNISQSHNLQTDSSSFTASSSRSKIRQKAHAPLRRPVTESSYSTHDYDEYIANNSKRNNESSKFQLYDETAKIEASVSGWEAKVKPADLERAVLSLLEFGQIVAAKQLQLKLSPTHIPSELLIVDVALKIASLSSSDSNGVIRLSTLDQETLAYVQSSGIASENCIDAFQALDLLALKCHPGCGRGLCRRIIAILKASIVLGILFSEAFGKQPIELLQLLSLKAQDSLEEAKLLVQTHFMPSQSIARILAESFLKGLLAAHRGGYMDSQKEEGPAPLLWRFTDFLKWAELCPSESEIGHALMRLVMTGQDIPHACEVELLILSHHFYKSSACLDGVDVLVTLAANRVESYVQGDFSCLARLVTGVSNFHALNFILNILIENGKLELLLQKYSSAETSSESADAVRGFLMAVLASLKHFNPDDHDAFAMVYNHFAMKHETAALLESRSMHHIQQWNSSRDKDRHHEDLLEAMHYLIEAAEVYSTIDTGYKTHHACARASLLALQIRIPDIQWFDLSETNARRALVEQSRFQEALIVAEAYNLNQPSEWALVLWNQMLKPDLVEQFIAEFVTVLPLQSSMLLELAKFYRSEVAARGDQSHFSVWLSPGGLPAEWVKHLGRSFRSLLRRTRDLRIRVQLATVATGFEDVTDACMKVLDKVPDVAGPLILKKGHGGAYVPLM